MLKKLILIFGLICSSALLKINAQELIITQKGIEFPVRITVVDDNNRKITNDVEIYASGKFYNTADVAGRYIIKAKVGDEIRVSHPDFETVYHTITSSEDIKVKIEGTLPQKKISRFKSKSRESNAYLRFIDSAKFYKKKDVEKSLDFIEKALKTNANRNQNAQTYRLLADIYLYWKQYDLAVYNYKLSNQISENSNVKIQLANAQFLQKKYTDSKATYKQLLKERLTDYQKIQVFDGLGNVNFNQKEWEAADANFNEALALAQKNELNEYITDLNSKIADVLAAQGKITKAEKTFQNTLDYAKRVSPSRVLKEEEKVADFYNKNNRFDDEIALRKKSLNKAVQTKVVPVTEENTDSITSQKINYKIGNAYLQKRDFVQAIPYLEKSIQDAERKNDLIVAKDAKRKISEVYANIGDEEKALKSYKEYVALVDTLYTRKQQEIQQVKRFSQRIADNQNRISSLEKDQELAETKLSLAYIDQKLSEESNRLQRIFIYSLLAGIILISLLAFLMYRNIKQQKLANNLLALKSMRSQMNPHFIFNALNSVNSFIAVNDERNANRYLSEFSVLMRSVLENSDEDFIPLTKEIELLELYVKLEHNRFKDKFVYNINIDENIALEQYAIPPMLLQPYIENAIWHGLRYKEEKGNLTISIASKDENTVEVLIVDDGIGRKKSQELKTKNQLKQKSKGMSTIKNRIAILNEMYKERISVSVTDAFADGTGTKVQLQLKKE